MREAGTGCEIVTKVTMSIKLLLFTLVARTRGDALSDAYCTSSASEVLEEETLNVTGSLPRWLHGDYFLNSAAEFGMGKRNMTHVFDGFSKVLRWRFPGGDGQLPTFRARMLQSQWRRESVEHDTVYPSAAIGPMQPPFTKFEELKTPWDHCNDNFNVNIFGFGPGAPRVALGDVSDPKHSFSRLDADDLTSSSVAWGEHWAEPISDRNSPAHPRVVPDGSGDVVGVTMRVNPLAATGIGRHSLVLWRLDAKSADVAKGRTLLHKWKVPHLPFVHSIGLTRTHAIVCAGPVNIDAGALMIGKPFGSALQLSENFSTVYLVPLDPRQKIVSYRTEPFFAFHHVNAWDDAMNDAAGGASGSPAVVFELVSLLNVSSAQPDPTSAFQLGFLRSPAVRDGARLITQLRRLTLPLGGGTPTVEILPLEDATGRHDHGDLPTINPSREGVRHCFVYLYAPQLHGSLRWSDMGIVKKNVCNASAHVQTWHRPGHFPGEAFFVAAPEGHSMPPKDTATGGRGGSSAWEEDDGVLLSAVHDGVGGEYLVVINATTMATISEVRRHGRVERLLGFGIHGRFFHTSPPPREVS